MFKCPACGQVLKVIALTRRGAGQATTTFALGSSDDTEPVTEELRPPTVESDVKVPLYLALVTSAVVTLGTLTLALLWGYNEWGWPWYVPLVAGVGAGIAWWFGSVNDIARLVKRRAGQGGREARAVEVVQVEITDRPAKQMVFAQFEARPELVRRFATDCLNGRLTIHGSRLGRKRFEGLRDESVARGLLIWKDSDAHAQGCELTAVGRHVFKRLIE